jgi:hypothetical protein
VRISSGKLKCCLSSNDLGLLSCRPKCIQQPAHFVHRVADHQLIVKAVISIEGMQIPLAWPGLNVTITALTRLLSSSFFGGLQDGFILPRNLILASRIVGQMVVAPPAPPPPPPKKSSPQKPNAPFTPARVLDSLCDERELYRTIQSCSCYLHGCLALTGGRDAGCHLVWGARDWQDSAGQGSGQ